MAGEARSRHGRGQAQGHGSLEGQGQPGAAGRCSWQGGRSRQGRQQRRGRRRHGWALVDTLDADGLRDLETWIDEIAAAGDATGVLQYRELTDDGPKLCRSENFVPFRMRMCRAAQVAIVPLSGVSNPAITRRTVLFPEPEAPKSTVTPASAIKATSREKDTER